MLLNCPELESYHISQPTWVTKSDLPIVKVCFDIFLCLIQNTLYSKKCLKEQLHACFLLKSLTFSHSHMMLLEPNNMDDVLSWSIKQNNSSWYLCPTVLCTEHLHTSIVRLGWLHVRACGLRSCCSTVNSAFVVPHRMNFLILPSLWRLKLFSRLQSVMILQNTSFWWFSSLNLNFVALFVFAGTKAGR